MSTPHSADVLAGLRAFVARIDELDPEAPVVDELTIGRGEAAERLQLRLPVARALIEALLAYRDPRDRGSCSHCGSRHLDDYFVCGSCGGANGVFGAMIAERAARSGLPSADPSS